uniref:Rho-GAP domain-containing protein n=1 Tax=Heterorhabditis bacteriophora TaxID=37862 RepID=A0A1I7XH24_HETBA
MSRCRTTVHWNWFHLNPARGRCTEEKSTSLDQTLRSPMETRNLALMFGPSIVRPSDDNMATMVTHMSDQCKIIETLIHYHDWMFDDSSTVEDDVPDQHPSETGPSALEAPQYGVGVPTGVSAASFNDMHNLIRKANEDQAAAMMNEGKTGKIKNILRRNSRRDRSKSKLKIESTAPAAINPRNSGALATPTQSSVDSTFCGNYQIYANSFQCLLLFSSFLDITLHLIFVLFQDIYSARRIFIAGSAAAATSDDTRAIDALASHTHHLNLANSPALEVLSEETREKIRRMQRKQTWIERPAVKAPSEPKLDVRTPDYLKVGLPSLAYGNYMKLVSQSVVIGFFSNPSPCARNVSTSPRVRPQVLALQNEARCQQKIRLRNKAVSRDSTRRHTLSDMDTLKL